MSLAPDRPGVRRLTVRDPYRRAVSPPALRERARPWESPRPPASGSGAGHRWGSGRNVSPGRLARHYSRAPPRRAWTSSDGLGDCDRPRFEDTGVSNGELPSCGPPRRNLQRSGAHWVGPVHRGRRDLGRRYRLRLPDQSGSAGREGDAARRRRILCSGPRGFSANLGRGSWRHSQRQSSRPIGSNQRLGCRPFGHSAPLHRRARHGQGESGGGGTSGGPPGSARRGADRSARRHSGLRRRSS